MLISGIRIEATVPDGKEGQEKSEDREATLNTKIENPGLVYFRSSSILETPILYTETKTDCSMTDGETTQEQLEEFYVTERKIRPGSTDWMRAMREGIPLVMQRYAESGPLIVRAVYYLLLSAVLITLKATNRQNQASYKKLSMFLRDARLEGHIPWHVIEDRTRQPRIPGGLCPDTWELPEPEDFMRYAMDEQPNYLELWIEKEGSMSKLDSLSDKWGIMLVPTGGNQSVTRKHELVLRLREEAEGRNRRCIVLVVSDLDADGEKFPQDIKAWLKLEGVHGEVKKVALTWEQVEEHHLIILKKTYTKTKAHYRNFVKKYGNIQVELDALHPKTLIDIVEKELSKLLDLKIVERVRAESQRDGQRRVDDVVRAHLRSLSSK